MIIMCFTFTSTLLIYRHKGNDKVVLTGRNNPVSSLYAITALPTQTCSCDQIN